MKNEIAPIAYLVKYKVSSISGMYLDKSPTFIMASDPKVKELKNTDCCDVIPLCKMESVENLILLIRDVLEAEECADENKKKDVTRRMYLAVTPSNFRY